MNKIIYFSKDNEITPFIISEKDKGLDFMEILKKYRPAENWIYEYFTKK